MRPHKRDRLLFNQRLGAAVTKRMTLQNVIQADICKVLGCTGGQVSRLLSGQSGFDCWQIHAVAHFLGVKLNTLYEEAS